jgi:DNA replication protein DnaD
MKSLDKELLRRIEELRDFCETNGYPLSEVLEEELEYYNDEFTE